MGAGNVSSLCCFAVLLQLANVKTTYLNTREVSLLTVLRFRAAILFLFMLKSVHFSVVMSGPQHLTLAGGGGLTWHRLFHFTAKQYTKKVSEKEIVTGYCFISD